MVLFTQQRQVHQVSAVAGQIGGRRVCQPVRQQVLDLAVARRRGWVKSREIIRRCGHLRIKGGGPGGVTECTDGVDLKGNQRPGLMLEKHPCGLVEAPLQRAVMSGRDHAPGQHFAQ
ncbi:hypothetical protein D3C73_1257590 [compost metagenome]